MLSPFECLCGNFILPEPASYVFFYAIFNLRNLLYIIVEKLPKTAELKEKRRQLAARKRELYNEYCSVQEKTRQVVSVKANIDHLLSVTDGQRKKEQERHRTVTQTNYFWHGVHGKIAGLCGERRRNGAGGFWGILFQSGNVKKCAVGKHPKSEKHGNTAQFSEVERSGTQENCGGIGSGCRLRLHPLPVLRRRQSHRVACIDPDAVVVDKNIAKNDRFDLFSR